MTQAFLLIVTPGPETKFREEPEFFKAELEAFCERLVKFHSGGTIPAVRCFIGEAKQGETIKINLELWK
jgi:hypothetical protein